jgi:hypothetical protein
VFDVAAAIQIGRWRFPFVLYLAQCGPIRRTIPAAALRAYSDVHAPSILTSRKLPLITEIPRGEVP